MKQEVYLTLEESSDLIKQISGQSCSKDVLRNYILRGKWPYKAFKSPMKLQGLQALWKERPKPWLLLKSDVEEFSKDYKFLPRGRPHIKKKCPHCKKLLPKEKIYERVGIFCYEPKIQEIAEFYVIKFLEEKKIKPLD